MHVCWGKRCGIPQGSSIAPMSRQVSFAHSLVYQLTRQSSAAIPLQTSRAFGLPVYVLVVRPLRTVELNVSANITKPYIGVSAEVLQAWSMVGEFALTQLQFWHVCPEHPIYGQPRSEPLIPSIDLAYIQDMISAAIQIARDDGNLSAAVSRVKRDSSARLVVIFDLSKPKLGKYEITSHQSALEDEEIVDKERTKLTMDNDVFFCGRVPLHGDSSTLVVCMDRQLSRDDGTIVDREDIVKAYRKIWSREHSKKLSRT